MGFAAGQHDADLAQKLFGEGDNYDVFKIGPELHAFEGLVRSTIIEAKIDWEDGSFFGTVNCDNSWEAESHLQLFGVSAEPSCWNLAGYASGYVTRFFNRVVIFRETQCVCCGASSCMLEGRPIEAWGMRIFCSIVCAPKMRKPPSSSCRRSYGNCAAGNVNSARRASWWAARRPLPPPSAC